MVQHIYSFEPFNPFRDFYSEQQLISVQERLSDFGLILSPSQKDGKFAMDHGETITENVWSDFEKIVLHQIISSGPGPYEETTPILKLFNDIVYYSKAPFCSS
jgi:hypothetical protein